MANHFRYTICHRGDGGISSISAYSEAEDSDPKYKISTWRGDCTAAGTLDLGELSISVSDGEIRSIFRELGAAIEMSNTQREERIDKDYLKGTGKYLEMHKKIEETPANDG